MHLAPSRIPHTLHKLNTELPRMSLTATPGVEIPIRPLAHLHLTTPFQITMPIPQHQVLRLNITPDHTTKTQPSHPAQNPHTSRHPLCTRTLSIRPVRLPAVLPPRPINTHLPGMHNRQAIRRRLLCQHFISRKRALLNLTITRHSLNPNTPQTLCHLLILQPPLDNRDRMHRRIRSRLTSNQHGQWRKT